MEVTEVIFKTIFEVVVFGFFFVIFTFLNFYAYLTATLSFFLAHTCNWLFNGHLFVLGRFLGFTSSEAEPFIDYPDGIQHRLSLRKSIEALAFFGSLSRQHFSTTSDLDVRVIRAPGITNGLAACFWTFIERSRALLHRYPLDIYVIRKQESFEKLRKDEYPIILFDKTCFFSRHYHICYTYDNFRKDFITKYVKK